MKLMIASDIHGSAYYCEKLLQCIQTENPDKILLLGDLLYHGPRNDLPEGYEPKKVISMLESIRTKLVCVRGNCDTEVDQMVLSFPILADYCLVSIDDCVMFASHGHIYNENNLPPSDGIDVLLNGHTHIPGHKKLDSLIYVNPGSVSIPKNGSQHQYAIFEDREFIFRSLDNKDIDRFRL